MTSRFTVSVLGVVLGGVTAAIAWSQGASGPVLQTHRIDAAALPAPGSSGPNPAKIVPKPDDASLSVPPGLRVALYASGFKRPRTLVQSPDGRVFVSDAAANSVFVLHDADGNGVIEEGERTEFATGFRQPFGMAFHADGFYVANTDSVVRFPYTPGMKAAAGPPEKVVDLPHAPKGHWTRNIRFSPDGRSLYVTVGSSSDIEVEPDPLRATVLRFDADGSGREIVMTGVRNPVGLDFHPRSGEAWVAVQERDGLGDDVVPDYVARVRPGAFLGWPYAYIGPNEEPRRKGERPDLVKKAEMPDVLIQAHSAVMALVFYRGSAFPARYRDGAFVALRGSSNRSRRTGYKVVFLPFVKGKPTGSYEDFLAGWMLGEDRPEVWGRPVGLAVLQDGSLLVSEDGAGTIWRVSPRR